MRGFEPHDVEPLHAILADREVIRYMPRTEPWPIENVQKWTDKHWHHWEERGFGWWAVEFRESNELIGWCGLGVLDETEEVEVLYLLKRSHWGTGLATEAAKHSIDYAFNKLDIDIVIGLTHPDNIPSQRVLEKVGLSFISKAHYFGMELFRYTIDRKQYEAFSNILNKA